VEFLVWMDEWAGNQNPDSTHPRNSKAPDAGTVISLTA
jgi:hypothetical protein